PGVVTKCVSKPKDFHGRGAHPFSKEVQKILSGAFRYCDEEPECFTAAMKVLIEIPGCFRREEVRLLCRYDIMNHLDSFAACIAESVRQRVAPRGTPIVPEQYVEVALLGPRERFCSRCDAGGDEIFPITEFCKSPWE